MFKTPALIQAGWWMWSWLNINNSAPVHNDWRKVSPMQQWGLLNNGTLWHRVIDLSALTYTDSTWQKDQFVALLASVFSWDLSTMRKTANITTLIPKTPLWICHGQWHNWCCWISTNNYSCLARINQHLKSAEVIRHHTHMH